MYVPPAFVEENLGALHEFMERHSFGLLISQLAGRPFATHIPLLLDRAAGPQGTLIGHVARQNPHWHELADQQVLAVFSGPHSYISPTWYAAENTVPTWNYQAVHVYGQAKIIEDEGTLIEIVARTVQIYEQAMPQPWSLDSSSSFTQRLLAQIVGFRIEITQLEGKFKLSQNQPRERQARVITALRQQPGENGLAIAAAMDSRLQRQTAEA